jgi:zinc/manganese transport system permease protein
MTAALDVTVLGPALVAGLLVLATHVPLGRRVLDRGIVFIDIAIAQFAALGVIVAHFLLWEAAWATQTTAFLMAIAGALILNSTEKHWPEVQEAIIGSSFVVVASLGILLLARDPHGGEHLRDMLVGQILWTNWGDLIPLAVVSALVLIAWFGFGLKRSRLGFYLLFALAVTASVQVVGVFLVFASLIMPALSVRVLHSGPALRIGYMVGAAGYLFGLMASALFDLPSGAVIVCVIALVGASVAYATRWMGAARRVQRAQG